MQVHPSSFFGPPAACIVASVINISAPDNIDTTTIPHTHSPATPFDSPLTCDQIAGELREHLGIASWDRRKCSSSRPTAEVLVSSEIGFQAPKKLASNRFRVNRFRVNRFG